MPPRKKTRGTLKRSSSDSADEDNINSKRPRADRGDATSHISLDIAAAPRPRKQVTYKSKARQKAGLGVISPPKLTNFGFNVENKPKHGRALFHLSPSPRARAKRSKVFATPKASRRKSRGGVNTSAEISSRTELTVDEDSEEEGPEPNNSIGTSVEHEEFDDQPAPLPTLPAIRPIGGPGLEIRTPLQGRVVPTLQSLSKRPHTTPIPLFAATPRRLPTHLPPVTGGGTNIPPSPSKPNLPIFAPTPSRASAVPSTPAHKSRTMPIFTPSLHRTEEASPTKRPPPVFAPTENPFASVTTPAHSNALPTVPPKLPLFSAALPATVIPETPTTKGRSLPTFTPKMLFPPPIAEESEEKALTRGVSKPPAFGGVVEDEDESTPRANRWVAQPKEQDSPLEKVEIKQAEVGPKQAEDLVATPAEEEPADVSMADLFNNTMVQFTPRSARIMRGEQCFFGPPDSEPEYIESSQPNERVKIPQPIEHTVSSQPVPETKLSPLVSARVTRSRSRSESASASGSVTRGGSVGPSRAGSVTLSRAGSQELETKSASRTPSPIAENEPTLSTSRRDSASPKERSRSTSVAVEIPAPVTVTPRSASLSLTPLVTDQPTLSALKSRSQSRTNSMDEYRATQTAAMMMDTPRDEDAPSAFPNPDPMDPETSPLSSLPDDMSFSFVNGGDTTAGDTTMRDAGDTTVCPDQNGDTSMQLRQSVESPNSSPVSLPAPTSPVSSLPASPRKQPPPSSSPTRPEESNGAKDTLIPISDIDMPTGFPGTRPRSSSLTSMSELTDLSDGEGLLEVVEPAPATTPTEPTKSMIPVPKRPGTPGPPPRPPTPGKTKTPFGTRTGPAPTNGMTPGPSRNGVPIGLASVKRSGIPTPGPVKKGIIATDSILAEPSASAATLGLGNPTGASRSNLPARTRSGATKARSLAAPTASTAAKARAKVVTAPPPPRSRITSFMKPNSTANRPPASSSSTIVPPTAPIGANPSPRKGQSKDDSDLPGPRRSMISQDTQASLSSLSSALEKLARPSLGGSRPGLPPRPGTSMGFVPPQRPGSSLGFSEKRSNESGLKSSTGPGASKPVVKPASASTAKGKAKAKDESGDDGVYEESNKTDNKDKVSLNAPLRSCVIFVDVRTADGEDSVDLFADMLKKLGAKIVSRPTPSTTHIIFKSGHQSTLTKYKLYDDPKPFLVGIAWVVQCAERLERVDEEGFRVKTDEVSALDLKRRRKAELPHQMKFMARDPNPSGPKFGSMSAEASAVSKSLEASATEVMQDAELAAERGKQRVQQKLVPRVPIKKMNIRFERVHLPRSIPLVHYHVDVPTCSDILAATDDAVRIFEARGIRISAVGGLACKLEGNIRTPNDADLLVLDTVSSQEQLKQILTQANSKFYLIPARDSSATYKVLWYQTTMGIRVKVDLLQPGIMSIPDFSPDLIQYRQYLTHRIPVAPFGLVLLLKLQAWEQHQQSSELRYYTKHHTDAQDINYLLPQATSAGVTCDYLPSDFRREARRRVRAYVKSHPSSKEHWCKIQLRTPTETSVRVAASSRAPPSHEPPVNAPTTKVDELGAGFDTLADSLMRLRIHQSRLRSLDSMRAEAIKETTPFGRYTLTSTHRDALNHWNGSNKDTYEAEGEGVAAFARTYKYSCVFGSLAFKLLGVECQPNDVDLIVLDVTQSLEDLKEYLIKERSDSRFYLILARNHRADYRVLWYATRRGARAKVDILQPGEMSIPSFAATLIPREISPGRSGSGFTIPVAPLELVLLLKLQGCEVDYKSNLRHLREKEYEHVNQIRDVRHYEHG
ncbi:unnamed protein product [Rhizoctonia solani]|uniref:BRCT domain-containing protein n=1 Tax=Rhizoctonia solani TaxID=456999 RepID=A0A8H3B5W5_9AGAM|nr:unnamed protein product [Rhizoctonia solani]